MSKIMEEIDDYLLCLGEAGCDEMGMLFLLQTYINKVRGSIHIVNFSKINTAEFIDTCRRKWDDAKLVSMEQFDKRVIIVDNLSRSMQWVYDYIGKMDRDDYILITGAERLIPYSESQKLINTEFDGLTISASLMQEQDWKTFCMKLDNLYTDFQNKVQGILVNVGVDDGTRNIILTELENSESMSIITTKSVGEPEHNNSIINKFYEDLNSSSYDELIQFLDSNKDKLDNKSYTVMLSQLYIHFGLSNKAIKELNDNYSILSNNEKKVFADLLSREKGKGEECKKILEQLYREDRYLEDLMPSILRAYEKESDDIRSKWISIALEVDPNNPKVLEHYGNWLSHKADYIEASKVFRRLKYQLNNQYYEIVARINDILSNPPEDAIDIERYVLQAVQDYPELHNEAISRLVIYFRDFVKSEYITYKLLNNIDYKHNEKLIYQLLNSKLEMLEDIVTASKALGKLKPHLKEKDAKKISLERIKCIIKSIFTLAKYDKGYLNWRRFIDNCQSNTGWNESVYTELILYLDKLNEMDISGAKADSFITKAESCSEDNKAYLGIQLLRRIRTGEFQEHDVDSVICGLLKYAEVINDEDIKLWGRYYASIIYSLKGEEQAANNYAITILEYYNRVSYEKKDLCILLGLMAWANAQFRIGRETEGVICVMSCLAYVGNVNEIFPILEEGLNIIGRFFFDNSTIVKHEDKDHICSVLSSLSVHNKSLEFFVSFMSDSLDELVVKLRNKVSNYAQKDVEWAGDLTNLIATYIKREEEEEAIKLIIDNYDNLINAYKDRLDIRYKAVTSWSEVLFYNNAPSIKSYEVIKKLLLVAINDIENKRNTFHKEERAAIGDISKKVYRMYIEVITMMTNIPELKTITQEEYIKELELCINKLSPRSIIEQKNYNMNKTADQEALAKEREYLKLVEEYNILYKKTSGTSSELNSIGFKVEELLEYLKLNHPYYKSLPKVKEVNFDEIKNSLKAKEVFYQYIKLNIMSIQIIVTSSSVNIKHQLLDIEELETNLIKLNEGVYNEDIKSNEYAHAISKYFGKELMEYCQANEVECIYVMPDLSLGVYNLSMCNYDGGFLIDKTKSIINILDYDAIKNERCNSACDRIVNRIFGNDCDSNLKLINSFLQDNVEERFNIIENIDDNIDTLTKYVNEKNIETIFLYGHGVSDPNGDNLGGSLGIHGKRELIRINNIIEQVSVVKNIVLISCRGGVPLNSDLESSTGSWAELFETFHGNMMICKWDVNTRSSIFIIERILIHIKIDKLNLHEALVLAMREAREQYINSSYWAGIEFWMN